MKRVLFFVPLVLLLFAAPALAEESRNYAGLKGTAVSIRAKYFPQDGGGTLKSSEKSFSQYGFAVSAGRVFRLPDVQFRLELENSTSFGPKTLKNDKTAAYSFKSEAGLHSSILLNIYLDLPLGDSPAVPYIGAGMGLGVLRHDSEVYSGGQKYNASGTAFAFEYAMMAGLEIRLGERLSLDFTLRYLGGSDYDVDYGGSQFKEHFSLVSSEFGAGLRFYF